MRCLGIDPGAGGAIALFDAGKLVAIHDMPCGLEHGKRRIDAAMLGAILRRSAADHAWIERVSAMPGQGVVSMFTFGMSAGIVLGALGALAIPVTQVTAADWKTRLRVPRDKSAARLRASQLLPAGAHWWQRAKDDGRAEAALIGYYGHCCGGNAVAGAPALTALIEW